MKSINYHLALLLLFTGPIATPEIHAQQDGVEVVMISNKPLTNLWRIEDLISRVQVTLTNLNSDSPLDVCIRALVYEENSTDYLFYLSGEKVTLMPNVPLDLNYATLQISASDINVDAIDYDYYKRSIITTGSLPPGKYKYCVEAILYENTTCTEIVMGSDCDYQTISKPSPPDLLFPVNESIVYEPLPVFSWLPPMPSQAVAEYQFEIVEILDGQTPIEAFELNNTWYAAQTSSVSLQYQVYARELRREARYAWRVTADLGSSDERARITSEIWTFRFKGTEAFTSAYPYSIETVSPLPQEMTYGMPWFEWQLIDTTKMGLEREVEDPLVSYDLYIREKPGDDPGQARSESRGIFTYMMLDKNYLSPEETQADTLRENVSYLWEVIAKKDELIIARSGEVEFTYMDLSDFKQAAEILLDSVQVGIDSDIYGWVEPVSPGTIIRSEELSDIEDIGVDNLAYLFVIDNEPNARFGHPTQIALVEEENGSVEVYEANWFPVIEGSENSWKASGTVNVKDTEINKVYEVESTAVDDPVPVNVALDLEKIRTMVQCEENWAVIIDAGDDINRPGYQAQIAEIAARQANEIQGKFEKNGFQITRISQYSKSGSKSKNAIQVDPGSNSGAQAIRDSLKMISSLYLDKGCCANTAIAYNLSVIIISNAVPKTTQFKLYRADGQGVSENLDYFRDILAHLSKLPECVKICLFLDANFSGSIVNRDSINKYLGRNNYEILTAADSVSTTASGREKIKDKYVTASNSFIESINRRGVKDCGERLSRTLDLIRESPSKSINRNPQHLLGMRTSD